jgi:hypothetical protein
MKKMVLVLCLIVMAMAAPKIVQSFWSDPLSLTHQDITKIALTAPSPNNLLQAPFCFSTSKCFAFQLSAVKAINKQHWIQDAPANYNAINHFDSNSFVTSLKQMAKNRAGLNTLLEEISTNGTYTSDTQAIMWSFLGNILHAAEDFYAHSTWVDEGNNCNLVMTCNIVNFGALTEDTSNPVTSVFLPLPSGTYCGTQQYPLSTTPINYLITGYYPPAPVPAGGCIHGDTFVLFTLCARSLVVVETIPGISHDVACPGSFSPSNTRQLYLSAYNLAIQEAQSLVQSIVKDLVATNNVVGFCALLALPSSEPMCSGPFVLDPASVSVSFSLSDIGSDGYGSIVTGPGSASNNCGPCSQFTSSGGTYSDTLSVIDTYDTGLVFNSSLQGNVEITTGATETLVAAANWSAAAGPFQGNFSGAFNFAINQPYSLTIAPTCSQSSSVTDTCSGSFPAATVATSGGSLVPPQSPNAYTLPAGNYTFGWGLIGGTGPSCCIGAPDQGTGPTATATLGLSASFHRVVTVGPTVIFTASPTSVTSGNSSTLAWNSPDAVSCSGPLTTSTATSGSASTGPLSTTTTYSMTCTDANGIVSAPASVTVAVTGNITATFTYQGTIIGGSGSVQTGSGQFVYNTTNNTLSAFTLAITNQSTANPNVFNYSLASVSNFSYNQVTGALNLSTQPVAGTNGIYYPQLFNVTTVYGSNVGNTATEDFPTVPETSGPVVVTVTNFSP